MVNQVLFSWVLVTSLETLISPPICALGTYQQLAVTVIVKHPYKLIKTRLRIKIDN